MSELGATGGTEEVTMITKLFSLSMGPQPGSSEHSLH